ncbi:hypothetical protein ACFSLT_09330 [Novosphingobium resinovorum]
MNIRQKRMGLAVAGVLALVACLGGQAALTSTAEAAPPLRPRRRSRSHAARYATTPPRARPTSSARTCSALMATRWAKASSPSRTR